MMTSNDMNQFGGRWTMGKLAILKSYLERYTTALKKQPFQLTYVDAFAGNGYIDVESPNHRKSSPLLQDAVDSDAASVLQGSTRLALEVDDRPFDHFVFVEQNPVHARTLHRLRAEFPDRDIRIERADANEFLPQWCESHSQVRIPWQGHRAVIFLDPFATQVDWQTVQCIAETKSVDLWILFPLSALTRILPKEREPNEAYAATLDRVFGSREWRDALYQAKPQLTLLPDPTMATVRGDQQAIVDLYLRKLNSVFERIAPSPKWFYNSRNSPQFAFMFAAANPSGAHIAVSIANHLLTRW